jgi:hypothetical protein
VKCELPKNALLTGGLRSGIAVMLRKSRCKCVRVSARPATGVVLPR